MMLSQDRCREIADAALAASRADETMVTISGGREGHARFAVNRITQHQHVGNATLTVTAALGTRSGSATINRLDRAAVIDAVRMAEAAARMAPENPEHMPVLGPQRYADCTRAWHEGSAQVDPHRKIAVLREICRDAQEKELVAGGRYSDEASFTAIATSAGLFGYHRSTSSSFSITARTAGGDGSARARQGEVCEHAALAPRQLAAPTLERAVASRQPRPLAPGRYTVILAPLAWDEVLDFLIRALDARAIDEKRSALYDRAAKKSRLGEKVLGENVTIRTDLAHSDLIPSPFDGSGLPRTSRTWFERGVLKSLSYTRYWAKEKKTEPTPPPSHIVIDGEDRSEEELIRATKRGVYVSNIWYVRMVDPKDLTVTGLTRDGTFLIEDGKLHHPVNNFRFNDSPLRMLRSVSLMSRPLKLAGHVLPFVRIEDFNFHSISEAV